MLDQRERKVTVLVITKCRVEARKQTPAKHQRKTRREQCRRDPMAGIVEILPHEGRPSAHAPTLPSPARGGGNKSRPSPARGGYGIPYFDSRDEHVFDLPSRIPLRIFAIPEGISSVLHCRRANGRGTAMSDVDEFHLGHFGNQGRQRVGAEVLHRVVETGSLVVRQLGGDRSGEKSIHNFLSRRPEVTPDEILSTAARRTAL